jgi:hypothetical protein
VRAVHPALVAHIRFGDAPPAAAALEARFFAEVARTAGRLTTPAGG